ncbi:MAG: AsmA family protein, partial [Bryobacteraceae bacterium]
MLHSTLIRKLRPSRRQILSVILSVIGMFIVLGVAAPFLDGSRFGGRIKQTLESTLGRSVAFEEVHFTVFSGPGFSLENVTIGEDPRFGLEPFAFVPTLQARIRLDKLLLGQIRFSSFRLIDPSLNFVKRSDETWNVVELVQRLSAPRSMPLNFFPVFVVSGGRIDFKFETRKTTLYILDSDLSIYPAQSGKLSVQFSGYPARSDRAGHGFAYLRGALNWSKNVGNSGANGLDGDVYLDPSNLGELTTLVEGHDVGVHGTVSTHARIKGPLNALSIRGELKATDVHRWDLLPENSGDWHLLYGGTANLVTNELRLRNFPPPPSTLSPVVLEMTVRDFLRSPKWSVNAHLDKIPVRDVLPISSRMGLALPSSLNISGTLGGVVDCVGGAGVNGHIQMENLVATLPGVLPVRAEKVTATISDGGIRFDPAQLETQNGVLTAAGDLRFSERQADIVLSAQQYPVGDLKEVLHPWLGDPPVLEAVKDGLVSGAVQYRYVADTGEGVWSGNFRLDESLITFPGLVAPLENVQARIAFDQSGVEVSHLATSVGSATVHGSYRYVVGAKRPERLHLDLASAKMEDLETMLAPTLESKSWLSRLGVTRRSIPQWLASRDLEGDLNINNFGISDTELGKLSAHFLWQGTTIEVLSLQVKMPEGTLQTEGKISLSASTPRFDFKGSVTDFPWRGGLVDAEGTFQTAGTGDDRLRNLQAAGDFIGKNVALDGDDS